MRTSNHEPMRAAPALYPELGANTRDRACDELPVRGTLPAPLRGVLYRNGPGLFRRHGRHKGSVLDGDGVLQRLELDGGRARYTRPQLPRSLGQPLKSGPIFHFFNGAPA